MHVGVVGGGQLGRMLGLAGLPMGCRFTFIDPSPEACAGAVGDLIVAPYDDEAALQRIAQVCDVVTFEFENVPGDALRAVAGDVDVFPPPGALEACQDRLSEKEVFAACGFGLPRYAGADDQISLEGALQEVGLPAVVKTRREGYDGKGQRVVRDASDAAGLFDALGGVPLIVEELVRFAREISIVSVRGRDGSVATYPLVENVHGGGILRTSHAPAPRAGGLEQEAQRLAGAVLDELDHVGVLAIEMFEVDGRLLANEMAPRVHNSGHWTIEGAVTSQFENHVRAVAGWTLGSTGAVGTSLMVNLIGDVPEASAVSAIPGAHLHLYGKAPREGRKVGHVTIHPLENFPDAPSEVLQLPGAAAS